MISDQNITQVSCPIVHMNDMLKLMKIAFKDKDEVYLIWMIGIGDCI